MVLMRSFIAWPFPFFSRHDLDRRSGLRDAPRSAANRVPRLCRLFLTFSLLNAVLLFSSDKERRERLPLVLVLLLYPNHPVHLRQRKD